MARRRTTNLSARAQAGALKSNAGAGVVLVQDSLEAAWAWCSNNDNMPRHSILPQHDGWQAISLPNGFHYPGLGS